MNVLGIDPGTRLAGLGVVRRDGNRTRWVASTVVRMSDKAPLEQRLDRLYRSVCEFIDEHRPASAALEAVYQHKYARSALILGHARGVALLACGHKGLEVIEYQPSSVKQAVAGSGRAGKDQVKRMVEIQLGRTFTGPSDETDALALAICHAQASGLRKLAAEAAR